ncbi:amino-acid N-acetyltransferase [Thiomicrospira sp. WB1]|uniref:amino-acid N-acetyltransferase n=1 Tax=Thiomicrospira sp. WB1 TaxID=1685380 RepID=UPI001F459710|nr:amino-acid N-acetyltransferase [Thiomicrospira sp. WB1]
MEPTIPSFTESLRQASPYLADHRDKTLVLYWPSDMIADPAKLQSLARDCVLLNSLGLKLVITLGAGAWLNQAYRDAGVTWQCHQNTRITGPEHLPLLESTVGRVRARVESAITQASAEHHLPGALVSGNWVVAKPKGIIDGIDFQHTGSVRKINRAALSQTLQAGQMVLITPLAYSLSGEAFNLNTMEQAFAISELLEADKLMLFQASQELKHLPKAIKRSELTAQPISERLQTLIQRHGKGLKRVHLIADNQPDALLTELFSRDGAGTLIYTDRYHQLRPAQAEDIPGLMRLIQPLEAAGILVSRSPEQLEQNLSDFWVMEIDQHLIGCAALHSIDAHNAELSCLAVEPGYQDQGLGQELLNEIEQQAHKKGYQHLWLLTTHTHHWFEENGFDASDPEALPAPRKNLYNAQRNSKVLVKPIQTRT